MTTTPEAKRLDLISDLVPARGVVAALIDPNYHEAAHQEQELQTAARAHSGGANDSQASLAAPRPSRRHSFIRRAADRPWEGNRNVDDTRPPSSNSRHLSG